MRPLSLVTASLLLLVGCGYDSYEEGMGPGHVLAGDGGLGDDARPTEGTVDSESDHLVDGIRLAHPEPAVAAAIEAWRWRHATLGDVPPVDTERCEERLDDLEVVVPSHREFRRLCQRCDLTDDAPQCEVLRRVAGCAPWGGLRGEEGSVGVHHALVVLDATLAADPVQRDHLVIHETIHHLGECSDAGPDSPHEQSGWWCVDEPSCINGRARALMSR